MEVITKAKMLRWYRWTTELQNKRQSWSHVYDFISIHTVLESSV